MIVSHYQLSTTVLCVTTGVPIVNKQRELFNPNYFINTAFLLNESYIFQILV